MVGIWSIPNSPPQEEHRYQHSVMEPLCLDGNVVRTDGLTKISNNKVHLMSVPDDNMPDPIVLRFRGEGWPFSNHCAISGTIG
ncbi:hypothetical protein O9929_21195 [Vibrio lentus]|nr:hypothetical protein [Vibrio lentus]